MIQAIEIKDFKQLPVLSDLQTPKPSENEFLIKVLAASVNQRVHAQADGSHYTSTGQLPLVPGVDGVGMLPNGQKGYFMASNPIYGALATQTVVDKHRFLPLSSGVSAVKVAGAMNPAMSSWMAIQTRIAGGVKGKSVLILGATGNAGKLAVQICRYLGASKVIGVGRNPQALDQVAKLGADQTINLQSSTLAAEIQQVADVDVVLDYLWGPVTAQFLTGMLAAKEDPNQLLTWVEIGSSAGHSFDFPSAALRSTNLTVIGSGQGSISAKDYLQELPKLAELLSQDTFQVDQQAVPLSDFNADNWQQVSPRVVYTMD